MAACYFKRESDCPDRCVFRQARKLAPGLIDQNIRYALQFGSEEIEGFNESLAAVILNPDAVPIGGDSMYNYIIAAEIIRLYGVEGTQNCALLCDVPFRDLPRRRATGN